MECRLFWYRQWSTAYYGGDGEEAEWRNDNDWISRVRISFRDTVGSFTSVTDLDNALTMTYDPANPKARNKWNQSPFLSEIRDSSGSNFEVA